MSAMACIVHVPPIQRYFYPASEAAEGEPPSRAPGAPQGGSPLASELALTALADASSPESKQQGAPGTALGVPSPQVTLFDLFENFFPFFSVMLWRLSAENIQDAGHP